MSASPFIDEGDGLTSEREVVCLLLSLATNNGGYMMMVGAHNTIGCWMHVGGYIILFWVWQMSVPTYIVDAQRHVRSFTMFPRYGKFQRHNVVYAQRHVGGPYRMGVNGAHTTIGKKLMPTTLLNVRCTWEVASSSLGMADVGTCHTVDARDM